MQAAEGRIGRIFVLRIEHNDVVPECIERFAEEKGISVAHVIMIGGVWNGQVVVGPRDSEQMPPEPMALPLEGAHEIAGVGVIALNDQNKPVLHIHAALGRSGQTVTGCLRKGVRTWLVGEAILYEITGVDSRRVMDTETGFALLRP